MTGFGIDHLPYGVAEFSDGSRHLVVRLGDDALDLAATADRFDPSVRALLRAPVLNPLMGAGPEVWTRVRERIGEILTGGEATLLPVVDLTLVLAWDVGDYVDFYSSEHHATNVGRMFRPDAEPLLPNWKHLPVGYHGRAGTVVVSGTPIQRPCGQRGGRDGPTFGPSERLDVEAEVGFVVGVPSARESALSTVDFAGHVFGVVLVNDWSARDLQAWEYAPLGPFLAKSFATSVSAWVTPLAALAPAVVQGPVQDPPPFDYLCESVPSGLDLELSVQWNGEVVSRPPFREMYWSPAQQLAHLTVNGASVRTGDLYASGTVSGPSRNQRGSFLELCWNGADPITLADGSCRTFLEDGDVVVISGSAPAATGLTLGEVIGAVIPVRGC
jgi:fumarylacetoacetase